MKKVIAIMLSSSAILLTGCATTMQPTVTTGDKEPILIGKPVAQRITESSKEINAQLDLLNKLQTGERIGNFAIIQHNNNLEARVGSDNTIPASYGKSNEPVKQEPTIKRIEWKNNSLNKLVGNFATAMGYKVVIKAGSVADQNVTFLAEKLTLAQSLEYLKGHVRDVADIVVVEQNKTINVLYK